MSSETDERIRARFVEETTNHKMTILRDDGLYRHVRFRRPDTIAYSFDLLTWPGYLTICGDMGCYVFARLDDMFMFFAGDIINPPYWSEKLQAPKGTRGVCQFSQDVYAEHVEEWLRSKLDETHPDEADALRAAVQERLLTMPPLSSEEAHDRLREFDHEGVTIYDSWEWDLSAFEPQFLWCCHAIQWGVHRYREATEKRKETVHV